MAAATRLSGEALYVEFGTDDLSGDWRAFTPREAGVRADRTAADDTSTSEKGIRKEGSTTFEALFDSSEGTYIWSKVVPNTEGTLIWAEEGTASGKPKHTVDGIVRERSKSIPYDGMIAITVEFGFQSVVTDSTYA